MRSNTSSSFTTNTLFNLQAAILVCAMATLGHAAPQSNPASVSPSAQRSFSTAQQAADALIQAAEDFDVPALLNILGPDARDLVSTEDAVQDKKAATETAAKARAKHNVLVDPKNSKRAILIIGDEDWPLPIPIVEKNGKWSFDTKAGREEVLYRRIGGNELDAITICRGFVEAQMDYAKQVHDDSGVNQYAQKIISTPGKQDGLAWRNSDGSWGGPIGETVANALEAGYMDKQEPFHGYYFKVLKGQGPNATLGRLDYVIDGAMIGGFALLAAPAEYRVTGVNTFMVGYDGVVYQKDLGPDTLKIAKSIDRYDPDKTWQATDDGQ